MLNGIRMKERLFYIVAAILESNPATSAKVKMYILNFIPAIQFLDLCHKNKSTSK